MQKCLAVEVNGTETFLSHIKRIIENETLKFPFICTERDAKCQGPGLFKLKGLAKAAIQKVWASRLLFNGTFLHITN